MKLSQHIRRAADTMLWDGSTAINYARAATIPRQFSCHAVCRGLSSADVLAFKRAFCALGGEECQAFHEFEGGPERQSVRYAWLRMMSLYLADNPDEDVKVHIC